MSLVVLAYPNIDASGLQVDQAAPLVVAVRWSICEAELLQVIARGRGIRRTEANPLDVLLLGNVPLPLKIDTVASWEQAQPTPLELLAARGLVPDCKPDAKGYWPTVQAMLPDVFKNVQAVKDAAKGSQWKSSIGTISIDRFHRESWQPRKARPHGSRYSVPVLVDPERLADLAAILELDDRAAIALQSEAIAAPAFAGTDNSPGTDIMVFADLPAATPAISPQYAREAPGHECGLRKNPHIRPVISAQYAREAPDPLADYGGGIMPELVRDQVRDRWRASGLRQDQVAERAGISRPQLANALQGRFGLSPDAAARLRAALASLPSPAQGALL
jgi:hypothetical protein